MKKININLIVDGKNKKSFLVYLSKHPQERMFQALRNWSGYNFILGSSHSAGEVVFDEKGAKKYGRFNKKKFKIEETFYLSS